VSAVNAAICSGEFYVLPSGKTVSVSGIYKDTVKTASGCDSLIRTVNLTVNPKPLIKLSKSNDINCVIGTAKLTATGGTSYLWSPAVSLSNPYVNNPTAFPSATTVYKVKVTNAPGCVAEESIKVVVTNDGINEAFPVPNSFTPNGDGLNDCFSIKHWGAVNGLKFEVFNRWGERLFYTNNVNECWDGTFNGVQQPGAVYVYRISAETICGKVSREGTITLIR
jgi:gliding motility-associated-like protein